MLDVVFSYIFSFVMFLIIVGLIFDKIDKEGK